MAMWDTRPWAVRSGMQTDTAGTSRPIYVDLRPVAQKTSAPPHDEDGLGTPPQQYRLEALDDR